MSFDFGFALYFLEGPKLSALELFFVRLQRKVQLHQRHHKMTDKLYRDEYREQINI